MTWDLGYLTGTAIFLSALLVLVVIEIAAKKFDPFVYWTTIVASTTAGTTMADFATRSLGVGYTGGSLILFACLMAVLGLWYWSLDSISVATVNTPKVEAFDRVVYHILPNPRDCSGGLDSGRGPRLRRWIARIRRRTGSAHCRLFLDECVASSCRLRAAFILTRPLGATVGDFLDKPLEHGGLALS